MWFKKLFKEKPVEENVNKKIISAEEAHILTVENIETNYKNGLKWTEKIMPKVESEINKAVKSGTFCTSIYFENEPVEYIDALSAVLKNNGYYVTKCGLKLDVRW